MANLTVARRNKLPKSSFGEPGERKYPMPAASHARNAKTRASEMEHKGKISEATEHKIDAKADRVLGKRKGNNPHGNPGHHASTRDYEHDGYMHTSEHR